MAILVTGGAGYIGTHTLISLAEAGYETVVVDNFSNSFPEALKRVEEITGKPVRLYQADVRDEVMLREIFKENSIECVIHFAGLKAVGESVRKPIEYYDNNLVSTLSLLKAMKEAGCRTLVFSSSATVYSEDNEMPLEEESRTGSCTNPYGWTKYMQEQILKGVCTSDPSWSIVLLRYFNPIGAHPSALIGEDPQGVPNNLMPYITQVAVGKRDKLHIFGDDYPTPDGTGVRDYIHVCDLARGHRFAVSYACKHKGCETFNLGTGKGSSVLDVVKAFEKASKRTIPYEIDPRRPGDLPTVYSCPDKAFKILGFKTELNLDDMCRDSWNWQRKNPKGFRQ
ncbi:MAG: UDP-glucose 4-epimerase GalE [Sphaerochaetaceae bacterium]|nr:UDP-glucose 4-epimerase GalE [Sphaerochaetaceae bacterium]